MLLNGSSEYSVPGVMGSEPKILGAKFNGGRAKELRWLTTEETELRAEAPLRMDSVMDRIAGLNPVRSDEREDLGVGFCDEL